MITQEEREKIYAQLAEAMMSALEGDQATEEDAAESAEIILKLDTIQTRGELIILLANLAARWNMYRSVYLDAKKDELLSKVNVELSQMNQTTS